MPETRESTLGMPETISRGIKKIVSMSSEEESRFFSALEGSRPSFNPKKLTDDIASSFSDIQKHEIRNIIDALISMSLVVVDSEIDEEKFITRIIDDVEEILEAQLPNERKKQLVERILHLLSSASLRSAAKSVSVHSEYDRGFHSARILTDVRPVFGDNVEEAPSQAIVVNILKINYHQDSGHKDFFVAMDFDDLQSLKKTVDRAIKKVFSVKAMLSKANVAFVDEE